MHSCPSTPNGRRKSGGTHFHVRSITEVLGNQIQRLYDELYRLFGPQDWWPADSPWEVAVGALLTQNTNWGNVEKAIAKLKRERLLPARKILDCEIRRLEEAIRPSGYFRMKALRLKNLAKWWTVNVRNDRPIQEGKGALFLRNSLLSVNGIGRETADSILLYSFDIPIFVIDAYTRRIVSRHFGIQYETPYDEIQEIFTKSLPPDARLFNEYHALIVRVGKEFCRKKGCAAGCPLKKSLKG